MKFASSKAYVFDIGCSCRDREVWAWRLRRSCIIEYFPKDFGRYVGYRFLGSRPVEVDNEVRSMMSLYEVENGRLVIVASVILA